jgi:hypothetical protein
MGVPLCCSPLLGTLISNVKDMAGWNPLSGPNARRLGLRQHTHHQHRHHQQKREQGLQQEVVAFAA